MLLYFLAGAAFGFAAGAQPGPLNAYLISVTLQQGFRRALPVVFAPLFSDIFVIALTLSVLTHVPLAMIRWLHLLGGAFVLYLAWDSWSTFRNFEAAEANARLHALQSVWKAAVVNLLNPNPYLGWSLVLGPLFLRGWHSAPRNGIAIGVGFYAALIATTILVLLLFDFARNTGPRVARNLLGLSSIALAIFGVYQLWLGAVAR